MLATYLDLDDNRQSPKDNIHSAGQRKLLIIKNYERKLNGNSR